MQAPPRGAPRARRRHRAPLDSVKWDLPEITLAPVELAALLAAASAGGVKPVDEPGTINGHICVLWRRLAAVDRLAADIALSDVVKLGASIDVVLALAELLDLESKVHDTTKGSK